MCELIDGQPLFPGESDIDQLYIVQRLLGPLTSEQQSLFLRNARFAGLKFPDMTRPETLERKYAGKLPQDALSFLRSLLALDPSHRLTCTECMQHPYLLALSDGAPPLATAAAPAPASVATTPTKSAPAAATPASNSDVTRRPSRDGGRDASRAQVAASTESVSRRPSMPEPMEEDEATSTQTQVRCYMHSYNSTQIQARMHGHIHDNYLQPTHVLTTKHSPLHGFFSAL